ncbi:MAG: hypothetical protein ACTSRG_22630 [Candidatus Helarchaeota archaeon]
MDFKKVILILFSNLFLIAQAFSIQIVSQEQVQQETSNETLKTVIVWVLSGMTMILGILFFIFIIIMIIMKIQKKISEFLRKKKDFLYFNFEENLTFCHFNRDRELKRRKKRTFYLTWKRAPIYCNTSDGLVQIGEYGGETQKKENFFCLALYNKLNLFKTIETIILIPNEIKQDILKKSIVNGEHVILLECDGVDEVGATDYYFQPLVKDPKSDKYLDFSEKIRKDFTNIVTYRNILKEELQAHRTNVIDSVEANPNIHFKRRGE